MTKHLTAKRTSVCSCTLEVWDCTFRVRYDDAELLTKRPAPRDKRQATSLNKSELIGKLF